MTLIPLRLGSTTGRMARLPVQTVGAGAGGGFGCDHKKSEVQEMVVLLLPGVPWTGRQAGVLGFYAGRNSRGSYSKLKAGLWRERQALHGVTCASQEEARAAQAWGRLGSESGPQTQGG